MSQKFISSIRKQITQLITDVDFINDKTNDLEQRIDKMANDINTLTAVLNGALQAMKDMETRVDTLITSLQNGPDLTAAIAEAQQIKDGLAAFHTAVTSSSSTSSASA